MRQSVVFAAIALAVVFPKPMVARQAASSVQKEIQGVEDDWAKAYVTKDTKILERILGAEFYIFSAWDGKKYTRADEIRSLTTDPVTFSSVTNTVIEVKTYGDIAIALGQFAGKGTEAGKPVDLRGTWQTIFAKRSGQWVAIASHAAPDPKAK